MNFVSLPFWVFFGVLLLVKNRTQDRKVLLLLASWVFYAAWDWRFLPLLTALSAVVWYLARRSRPLAGICLCLGALAVFRVMGLSPLGLSFYGLQAISYLLDVASGRIGFQSFRDVALYLSFFPTVVSGPIVKARDFFPQLETERPGDLSYGIQRFCLGLFKKVVIADRLGLCVDAVFSAPGIYSGASIALAVLGYAIQIFCDFSGYSDMAIGLARSLGFDLGENFRKPYGAGSLRDFWRRWHISLSTWFREYVYIPLGGSRRGRVWVHLLTVMVLSGLWHGVQGRYLLWGAVHGLLLILERRGLRLGRLGTLLAVGLLWIPFRASSLTVAWEVLSRMVTMAPGVRYYPVYVLAFGVPVLLWQVFAREKAWRPLDLTGFPAKVAFCTFLMLTFLLAWTGETAFLYAGF